ncbi:hypothetical protein M9Y10_044556 [Tritrichomonas musculus]|uniref:Inner centromere protein ARK-binding domain-containing protein n=1 Tax=Tritrichomonas musculus TaxID=1915356 RepID=A0ABR2JSZ0_9EUKA
MAHSSRSKEPVQPVIDYSYDNLILERQQSTEAAQEFINDLLTRCAKIIHEKEMFSRRFNFASHALSKELLMNISWSFPPLDNTDYNNNESEMVHSNNFDPDDDLEMPPIDEWAGGVLPVRDAEATGLRTAVDPTPKTPSGLPKSGSHTPRRRPNTTKNNAPVQNQDSNKTQQQQDQQNDNSSSVNTTLTTTAATTMSRTKTQKNTISKKKVKPPPTPADTILKTFEDIRKKSNVSTKSVTVDSDFSVIQITEPHGLPPSLIVPRIQTKKISNKDESGDGKSDTISGRPGPRTARLRNTIKKTNNSTRSVVGSTGITSTYGRATATIKKPEAKKRLPPKIIETDQPKFDTELSEVTFADRIALSPGVTFREGNVVKTRPPLTDENQMTRSQYEQYLEEMMRDTEQS